MVSCTFRAEGAGLRQRDAVAGDDAHESATAQARRRRAVVDLVRGGFADDEERRGIDPARRARDIGHRIVSGIGDDERGRQRQAGAGVGGRVTLAQRGGVIERAGGHDRRPQRGRAAVIGLGVGGRGHGDRGWGDDDRRMGGVERRQLIIARKARTVLQSDRRDGIAGADMGALRARVLIAERLAAD